MADRIKVYNDTKYDIGLKDQRGIEFNIKPGTFAMFEKAEVEYFVSLVRKYFEEPHRLRIDDQDTLISCGLATEAPSPVDESFIRKNLQQSVGKVKKYVEAIDDPFVMDTVCDVAISMDLPNSKMELFREKCPAKFEEE